MTNKSILQLNLMAAAAYLLLPCLFTGLFLGQWFPYHLTGKQFLAWYMVHMLTAYMLLWLAAKHKHSAGFSLSILLAVIGCAVALVRMVQGMSHHKPITFLVLLLLIHMFLLFAMDWNKCGIGRSMRL